METERLILPDEAMTAFDYRYARYIELGGEIDGDSFREVWNRAAMITTLARTTILQAEHMAQVAGFSLNNGQHLDEVTVFYGALRSGYNPEPEFHYSQMCDQKLLAEALKMLDRPDLLMRVIAAYHPQIRIKAPLLAEDPQPSLM